MVIVTYRVMPDGVDIDLDSLEDILKQRFDPQRIERIPLAFGLNSIKLVKVLEEEEGLADELAEKIEKVDGVKNVEVVEMTRSL